MNIKKYMKSRLYGHSLVEEEYRKDNYEFWQRNSSLVEEILKVAERPIGWVISIGGGEGLYERQIENQIGAEYIILDKRNKSPINISPDYLHKGFPYPRDYLFLFANFLHVIKNPADYLEALPKGAQVIIIDTFMAKPNSEWQLFFDNYMRQINGTRLPTMAKFESLPGWKTIAKKQNYDEYELGFLVLRKMI